MRHPIQRLLAIPERFLLAAAGPNIYCHRISDGSLVSSWTKSAASSAEVLPTSTKKRKRSSEGGDSSKEDGRPAKQSSGFPSVIKLAQTHSRQHVVAVTDDDKCVRVFSLGTNGQLELVNERCMPKRPCAVAISSDDAHIICGDKFGDVYALPLLEPSPDPASIEPSLAASEPASTIDESTEVVPPGPDEIVHTLHNKRAREQQFRDAPKPPARTTAKPDSQAQLLLGHVSMLTDLEVASGRDSRSSKARNYIISCDRDEHIRVSRGLPQSHIIENYCLGHKEFVSRLCIPDSFPDILISGGGDDELYIWDWQSGTLRQTVDLSSLFRAAMSSDVFPSLHSNHMKTSTEPEAGENGHVAEKQSKNENATTPASAAQSPGPSAAGSSANRVAVSGIWTYRNRSLASSTDVRSETSHILVACEGRPALFIFNLDSTKCISPSQTLPLQGNALDVAIFEDQGVMVVSVDNLHQPWSVGEVRQESIEPAVLLQCFQLKLNNGALVWREEPDSDVIKQINEQGSFEMPTGSLQNLSNMLYSVEKLRKRGAEY
ncbi:MAG: tRNA (guanine-N(7)-)-methyltransferase non-catalytic subunit trm82 [Watsoniomyces obsoletus]|nr:MAG: tRNA (guanine-N(7)-)-methyltransferase non-catalytic subunit trm82 [Watsoniomyces obsoletus]